MQEARSSGTTVAMPVLGIVLGIALVLIGQFVLDHLADTSDTWHWIQHGVLFLGGIAIGAAGSILWASGRQRA